MLIEFVVKEYFGGLRMEPRTFSELFVAALATIRETRAEVPCELDATRRGPKHTRRLRDARAEISRRELHALRGGLRFAVVDVFVDSQRKIQRQWAAAVPG